MTIPYIMGRDSITVMHAGETHTVMMDHVNYQSLKDAIREQRWEDVPDLVSPAKAVQSFVQLTHGAISIENDQVFYQGSPIHNSVSTRIIHMLKDGFDAQPLMNFLEKLMQNPSRVAVMELYDWLAGTSLPITEDGDFIAYKKVQDSYYDFHTGKVLNKPAACMTDAEIAHLPMTVNGVTTEIQDGHTVLHMPRNHVDDNRNNTCSQGLHFCSLSYLPRYHGGQGKVLLVRINPADVVSIPSDYDFAKGRAWRYTILGEHTQGEQQEAFNTSVVTATGEQIRNSPSSSSGQDHSHVVMGMDFGSHARAAQVQELLNLVNDRVAAVLGETPDQARIHGFDHAWDDMQPDLTGYTGSSMRGALEYARAYYESYDRCRGRCSDAYETTPSSATPMGNPALLGYNQGRKDGASGAPRDTSKSGFVGTDQARYEASYHKGYNSVS